jgi:ABC-type Zn uptake system ZnuABC Zn-binding protein ZnuA
MKTLSLIILFWFQVQGTMAAETFHCTHPQVCNLAKTLVGYPTQFKLISEMETFVSHHATPSPEFYKKLDKSDGVLYAPIQLEPWIKKRSDTRDKSYRLKMKSGYAHFWLHPDSLCDAEKQLISHFKKLKVRYKKDLKLIKPKKSFCDEDLMKSRVKKLVILTHDSMVPLINDLGHDLFIIKTHGEHHELNPKTLKKLTDKFKKNLKSVHKRHQVYWVIESQFHHPNAILNMIKKDHKVLKINTVGLLGDLPDKLLRRVMTFLE